MRGRQFGFLPLLTATVPQLAAHRGSTSIEICFNGMAIIFLLEIDNAIYLHWVSHSVRVVLNQDEKARMGEPETRLLGDVKRAHAVLAAVAIFGGSVLTRMLGRSAGWWIETIAHGVAFVAFLLGAVLEVSVGGKTVVAQLVSVAVGLVCLGFIAVLMEALFGL